MSESVPNFTCCVTGCSNALIENNVIENIDTP